MAGYPATSAIRLAMRFAADLTGSLARWRSGGGLDLGVAQELANHGQALADEQSATGKAMAEIVDPHVVEPQRAPDAPPGVLKVGQMAPRLAPHDHPGVVLRSVERPQHCNGRVAEMHQLGARLGSRAA